MQDPWSRSIECRDNTDRARALRVVLDERHRVVLLAPPGEAAVLEPIQIQQVKQALTDAQLESIHRRKTW